MRFVPAALCLAKLSPLLSAAADRDSGFVFSGKSRYVQARAFFGCCRVIGRPYFCGSVFCFAGHYIVDKLFKRHRVNGALNIVCIF